MDTALPQKFPFILDRNLAKANCTGNRLPTSCDTVVLVTGKRKDESSATYRMRCPVDFVVDDVLPLVGGPCPAHPDGVRGHLDGLEVRGLAGHCRGGGGVN